MFKFSQKEATAKESYRQRKITDIIYYRCNQGGAF